jgi:hypothetical protein
MTTARKDIYDKEEVGVYHCFSRCVRRAFLCGTDQYTGKNYDHRKQWLEELLELAASCYVVDLISFAVLDNHFHVLLRNRPDLKRTLTPRAVARRWLLLHPKRRDKHGKACEPTQKELREITRDKKRVTELRNRLANISWYLAFVKEKLARRANREDDVRGTFFEKRFEMRRLLTDNAVLACSVYIDLNEIRAGLAETPETSLHSSIFLRIQGLEARRAGKLSKQAMADRWLAPISATYLPQQQRFADKQWRASDDPALPLTIEQYLALVDWSGRQIAKNKAGKIPAELAPILDRLGISQGRWLDVLKSFAQMFPRIAGNAEQVEEHAARHQRCWFHGVENCRKVFSRGEP